MSVEYKLGLVLGMLVGLAIAAGFFFIGRKRNKWIYDERQKLARAKATQGAYITLLTGVMICVLAITVEFLSADGVMILLILSAIISVQVFACVCIHLDAWVALNERPRTVLCVCALALAANLITPVGSFIAGELTDSAWINLAVAVMVAVTLINYAIHRAVLRRGNDEEPEA